MKTRLIKLLSCLLATCMLIPVFAACEENTDTSEDTSLSTQQNPSDSENSSNETEPSGNLDNDENNSNDYINTEDNTWWLNLPVTPDSSFNFAECEGGYSITKFVGQETEVVIPSTYNGKPIVEIENFAFQNCASVEKIKISDSVTFIYNYTFYKCSGLVNINVDKGNTTYHSASNCLIETAEKTLKLGCKNSIIPTDGSVTSIGGGAFGGCIGLTSITIPNSIARIGMDAFLGCTGLTNITIPNSVKCVERDAFEGCTNIIQKENGVLYADKWVVGCDETDITNASITLRTNTVGVCEYAFKGCTELVGITVPDSVVVIGEGAFCDCIHLKSVTLGKGITSISESAFGDCLSLTSITIPSSVTSISSVAFSGCLELTSITIPDSVTSIGRSAFYKCDALTSIVFEDTTDWYIANNYTDWQNQANGTSTDVSNASTNATYFKDTYSNYYWYKK